MTTATASQTDAPSEQIRSEARLRAGTALMSFGALAFVGYAVIFFILNFTDRSLEG